jgi:hypothetical protein
MARYKKIVTIDNEVQARLLESLLLERNIPHVLRSYHDSAYDGLFQLQYGWGHVEASQDYEDEIKSIFEDIASSRGGEAAEPEDPPETS